MTDQANKTVLPEPSYFIGETPEETLHKIACVLQVLADASQYPGESEDVKYGTWLILQELGVAARSHTRSKRP